MRHVYLDHQSATPVRPEVFAAMKPYFTEAFGNPSSLHQYGLRARDAVAKARAQIAALINAESPDTIFFTSDDTESTHPAIQGLAQANRRRGNHLVISEIESPSMRNSVSCLEQQGFRCTRVKADRVGRVDPEAVRAAINRKTILIALHHANPELGSLQPVRDIGALAAAKGIPFYVDAAASAGWIPVDVQAFGARLLTFSPRTFYGPKGVGILYRQPGTPVASSRPDQPPADGRRGDSENIPAIVGAGAAAEIARRELPRRCAHTAKLQRRLWDGLQATIPRLHLNGPEPGPARLPTTLNVSFEFTEGEGLVLLCDLHGIAVASGLSCAGKSLKISHVLNAIGLDPTRAQGSLILSLGQDNTSGEMDHVIETLAQIVRKLRALSPGWKNFESGWPGPGKAPARPGRAQRKPAAVAAIEPHY